MLALLPQITSASDSEPYTRLAGQTRYQTSQAVAENYNSGQTDNIVIATGTDFADALSVSVLAHQLNAPILLVDKTLFESQDAFDYISRHMPNGTGTIWIAGGPGAVSESFELKSISMGHKVKRIGERNRYETSLSIAKETNTLKGTPIFLATGENFPDALSIASVAASKGYPIILTPKDKLPDGVESYLSKQQSSEVFIVGGTGVISESVEFDIKTILPESSITRLAGRDRFETSTEVYKKFFPNPENIYIASAMDFPDALSASVLAAKNNAPIVLINPNLAVPPNCTFNYLKTLSSPNTVVIGGTGVVPEALANNIIDILANVSSETVNYYNCSPKEITTDGFIHISGIASPDVKEVHINISKFRRPFLPPLEQDIYCIPQNRLLAVTTQLTGGPGCYWVFICENDIQVAGFSIDNTQPFIIIDAESVVLTAVEQEAINLVNQERLKVGLKPLEVDKRLVALARIKSQDMIDNNYYGHYSPTYGGPFEMMEMAGIEWFAAGENIVSRHNAKEAHDAFMGSPGHRANILGTYFTHIGIGTAPGHENDNLIFTQMFIKKI